VKLPKDATGTIILNINNKTYTSPIKNGELTISIPNLKHGKYNLNIIYSGDNKYNSDNYTDELEVLGNTILKVKNITMIYKDGTRFEAILTDNVGNPIFNVTLSFIINGQTYNKNTDNEGKASIGLNLNAGNYTSVVLYNGSKNYDNIFKNVTITINPTIISKDLVKMYQNDTRFHAKFTDSTGKALANTEIKFNINGVFYTKKTDKDGMGDLGIMLRPGSYILTAYNPVTGEEKGFNITVKSLIVQSDLTKYYLNASRFEATVYNKDGSLAVNKEVTFNINGVFYHKKTDENGVASLGIALRPGNYTITTMYDGLDIGNKVNVLPTLVTKDLSMKYLDGSNFTALTLDGQGKPLANQNVSFNVNG
ncbi:Ig-like domain-containing protein, partial [Methanobrevibacter smithii]